ncbi:TPA: CDP-diacylglycerol--glycerol-3-phosphate 3-phosphatidyltransferase [Candidatus Poribacteria bacterium]|nr:CDP-diacylglycerol--glycerol-3-phosphate 3-phosphatidyltransferase [Candidatus Poribacteria bacterium]
MGRINTLPNYLTMLRIILIPIFVILYYSVGVFFSMLVFVGAAYTDYLDGRIARKTGNITSFGKFLDPLADKLLVISALIVLLKSDPGLITTWMFLIIIGREVVITLIRTYAASKGNVIAATKLGKYKAASQLYAIALSLLLLSLYEIRSAFFSNHFHFINAIRNQNGPIFYLMLIPVILTVVSGLEFLYNNRKLLKI